MRLKWVLFIATALQGAHKNVTKERIIIRETARSKGGKFSLKLFTG